MMAFIFYKAQLISNWQCLKKYRSIFKVLDFQTLGKAPRRHFKYLVSFYIGVVISIYHWLCAEIFILVQTNIFHPSKNNSSNFKIYCASSSMRDLEGVLLKSRIGIWDWINFESKFGFNEIDRRPTTVYLPSFLFFQADKRKISPRLVTKALLLR